MTIIENAKGSPFRHWALLMKEGGETKLDNLVLLCGRHHRAVHEFGYHIERTNDGGFEAVKPTGSNFAASISVCTDSSPSLPVQTE